MTPAFRRTAARAATAFLILVLPFHAYGKGQADAKAAEKKNAGTKPAAVGAPAGTQGPAAATASAAEGTAAAAEAAAPAEGTGASTAGAAGTTAGTAERSAAAEAVSKAADRSSEDATTELDIRTSTLLELAAWCRSLGLSEGGTRAELAARLRAHYGLEAPPPAASEGNTVIVESARGTEYFTLEAVDEEYARLRGDVIVSLKDGDTTHRIRARELLYNKTRNVLTATGSVEYVKTASDMTEIFRGESLTVNMDTWAGVFLDGSSEKTEKAGDAAYRFSAALISRADEDVTILTDAVVNNAADEDRYWSLAASKIWLLPGSEWAIANAVLKVGAIPVLYIPFFYLPADEIVFHPVLGYRSREGSFVQTTTYLLGRPKASDANESSIMKIIGGGEDMEMRREGLFLRRTGKKAPAEERTSFALLLDAYTNLGYYIGGELKIPETGPLGKTDLSMGIGFTRDVYNLTSSYYSPFENGVGPARWNTSTFFAAEVPFRYRFKTTGSLSSDRSSLSWAFPFYSDPYVDEDFLDRSEEMDWFNVIKQGAATEDSDIGTLGSYEWRLAGSSRPDVAAFDPYFSTFNISSAVSSLTFKTKESTLYKGTASPSRTFFYPDTFTFLSLSATLAGKPVSTKAQSEPKKDAEAKKDPLEGLGFPRAPWEESAAAGAAATTPAAGAAAAAGAAGAAAELKPPALSQTFSSGTGSDESVFELSYTLSPSGSSDMKFRSTPWTEATEVTWDEATSILTVGKLAGTVTAQLTSPKEVLSEALSLSGNATWQGYTYANRDAEDFDTEAEWDAAQLRNYKSTFYTTSATNVVTARPFALNPVWSRTNLKHTLTSLLMKSTYAGATADDRRWKTEFGEWSKDSISEHSFAVNLAASVRELPQTLSLTLDLPPTADELAGNSTVRVGRSTTTASGSATEVYDDIEFKPFTFTETVEFGKKGKFRQEVVFDPGPEEVTSTSTSLIVGALSTSFTTAWGMGYELIPGTGWRVADDEERLRPKAFALGYQRVFPIGPLWKRRVSSSIDVNTSLALDLQRYTQSSFNFSLGTSLKIAEFLDLSLSVKSQNSVVFRYIQDWPWWDMAVDMPGETNILTDLFNSFRFGDEEARRSSGFKLKAFSLDTTHYMGDWNAKFSLDLEPYLDQSSSPFRYRFNPVISFLVQWVPISEIKVETYRDENGFVYK